MPSLDAVDEAFLSSAPVRASHTVSVPVSADTVWRELTNDTTLRWLAPGIRVVWGSPRAGVGAVRKIGPVVGPKVNEHYFLWEEGRRKAFYVTSLPVPIPGIRAFAEDYVVTPTEHGADFTWAWAIDGTGPIRNATPAVDAIVGFSMKRTKAYFDKIAASGG